MADKATLRQIRLLELKAAREQARLLVQMRLDVIAAMTDATGFRRFHLGEVLSEIDRLILRGRMRSSKAVLDITKTAWEVGVEKVDGVMRRAGARVVLPDTLFGLSSKLLQSVSDVTADQTRAVWSELGRKLKLEVRRATLGVTDPFQAMSAVAKRIKDPKTFGTAIVRAETIIRTEVGRSFEMAGDARARETDDRLRKVGKKLGKWWLYTKDDRTREAHIQAGRDYPKSKPIDIDEPFIVDGEELRYPLDPEGSAGNTINCRCTVVYAVMSA